MRDDVLLGVSAARPLGVFAVRRSAIVLTLPPPDDRLLCHSASPAPNSSTRRFVTTERGAYSVMSTFSFAN